MPDADPAWITFVSDYGLTDEFVGVCHGVIALRCPSVRVIDLNHGVARHDIRAGALALRDALAYLPVGVGLAVVDPDVGAERRAVALGTADGWTLVGPDNGLLMPAAQAAGGVVQAVDIARSPFRCQPVSATFHGRDIFSPVAAELAAGTPLAEVGDPLDPVELVRLELPSPTREGEVLVVHVLGVDRFGNLQLDAGHADLRAAVSGSDAASPFRVRRAARIGFSMSARSLTSLPVSCCCMRTPSAGWPSRSVMATPPPG